MTPIDVIQSTILDPPSWISLFFLEKPNVEINTKSKCLWNVEIHELLRFVEDNLTTYRVIRKKVDFWSDVHGICHSNFKNDSVSQCPRRIKEYCYWKFHPLRVNHLFKTFKKPYGVVLHPPPPPLCIRGLIFHLF